jgi:hypothetical protein
LGFLIPIGQQATALSERTISIDGGKPVASRQRYDLRDMDIQETVRRHD